MVFSLISLQWTLNRSLTGNSAFDCLSLTHSTPTTVDTVNLHNSAVFHGYLLCLPPFYCAPGLEVLDISLKTKLKCCKSLNFEIAFNCPNFCLWWVSTCCERNCWGSKNAFGLMSCFLSITQNDVSYGVFLTPGCPSCCYYTFYSETLLARYPFISVPCAKFPWIDPQTDFQLDSPVWSFYSLV